MSERGTISAHLGGIGAMLEAADVCPRCGETHASSPSASHSGAVQFYPVGSFESYPAYAPPVQPIAEVPRVPAGQRIMEFESLPHSVSSASAATDIPLLRDGAIGARRLMISWLPPPDLGEVF